MKDRSRFWPAWNGLDFEMEEVSFGLIEMAEFVPLGWVRYDQFSKREREKNQEGRKNRGLP
jgi:hypothetical protein